MKLNDTDLEVVNEAKLLGTIITDDLKWNRNTEVIVKKAHKRMQLLHAAANFTSASQELRSIYVTFVRSILEQSAVVWHSSLSFENRRDLERVQKAAVRVILGKKYTSYNNGLKMLNLETLSKRRQTLCLRFANNCLKNEKVKDFFPKNNPKHKMKKRKKKLIKIPIANTERYKKSAIPYMKKLLNKENEMKESFMN